jgi:hypothetical protein
MNASRNYETPRVDAQWAASRETHMAVATAIHAIADVARSAEAIWEAPTKAESDHVAMAVREYLDHGDFTPEPDGRYCWGAAAITLAH